MSRARDVLSLLAEAHKFEVGDKIVLTSSISIPNGSLPVGTKGVIKDVVPEKDPYTLSVKLDKFGTPLFLRPDSLKRDE
jgi:hypothetical protein